MENNKVDHDCSTSGAGVPPRNKPFTIGPENYRRAIKIEPMTIREAPGWKPQVKPRTIVPVVEEVLMESPETCSSQDYELLKSDSESSLLEPLIKLDMGSMESVEVKSVPKFPMDVETDEAADEITEPTLKPTVYRQQSQYENCDPSGVRPRVIRNEPSRPSKSMIYQFDPLFSKRVNTELGKSSLPIGNYSYLENLEDITDTSSEEYYALRSGSPSLPPTPPGREDSLSFEPDVKSPLRSTERQNSSTNWYCSPGDQEQAEETNESVAQNTQESSSRTSILHRFSNMLKRDLTKSGSVQPIKPPQLTRGALQHRGDMTRMGVDDLFKQSQNMRHCILSDLKLSCYSDIFLNNCREVYNLENLLSIHVLPQKCVSENEGYFYEMNFTGIGGLMGNRTKVVFKCPSECERKIWAQRIVESLTEKFPQKFLLNYTRAGWSYLKENEGGQWCSVFLMVARRSLVIVKNDFENCIIYDLRKARQIVLQEGDASTKQILRDDGPNLIIDFSDNMIYLHMAVAKETKVWRRVIRGMAVNNGAFIYHQQLTNDNIPTIVDKCISFLYERGCLSEGIYRKTGSASVSAALLADFRRDSWAVNLASGDYSEHTVASVLKRFCRELPESLIPREIISKLIKNSGNNNLEERCLIYQVLLGSQPDVIRQTVQYIIGHLYFVQQLSEENKMTAFNLAAVWGPSIMPDEKSNSSTESEWSQKEVKVLCDLILHYPKIYQPSDAEMEKEKQLLLYLQKVSKANIEQSSTEILICIYICSRQGAFETLLINHEITCADLIKQLMVKFQISLKKGWLEETICDGQLSRMIHPQEYLMNVILRWGNWDESDRKHNYLVLKYDDPKISLKNQGSSLTVTDLKFADTKTKSFKPYTFKVEPAKISCYKDKTLTKKVAEWYLDEIIWFSGFESKRIAPGQWAITFIPTNKPKRSKREPWFGCTISGANKADEIIWTSTLNNAQYLRGSSEPATERQTTL